MWEERNKRIFEDSSKLQQMIIDDTLFKLYDYVFIGRNRDHVARCGCLFLFLACFLPLFGELVVVGWLSMSNAFSAIGTF